MNSIHRFMKSLKQSDTASTQYALKKKIPKWYLFQLCVFVLQKLSFSTHKKYVVFVLQ
jgi:hypothetical protein